MSIKDKVGIENFGFLDDDEKLQGTIIDGLRVYAPSTVSKF